MLTSLRWAWKKHHLNFFKHASILLQVKRQYFGSLKPPKMWEEKLRKLIVQMQVNIQSLINSISILDIQVRISSFSFKFQFQVSMSNFNFRFQIWISISSLNFKFQNQVSISSFNVRFQFQVSISSFHFKFPYHVSNSSLRFNFQF